MPTVLSYANAFPGAPFSQHGSGQTTTVQNYLYPGAVQPKSTTPTVLSYTNAFPDGTFPQHGSGQTTTVQNYIYPGAVQPQWHAPASSGRPRVTIVGWLSKWLVIGAILIANPVMQRRRFLGLKNAKYVRPRK
jgi:hypothetical protein